MVAGLLSHPKRHFYPPENHRYSSFLITKSPGGTLLKKMSAEFPSTEQICIETSRLVPLPGGLSVKLKICQAPNTIFDGFYHLYPIGISRPPSCFVENSSPISSQAHISAQPENLMRRLQRFF